MDASSTTPNSTPAKEEPEKYIRTFAGDMDTLKKGGTPNLTPLDAPVPPKPAAVPSPPVVHTLVPPPATPVQPPVAPPPAVPPPLPKNPPLQTYSNDFIDRMKETHASTVTVLAAEQDNAPRTPRVAPQESPRVSLPYVIAGAVLLIASIAGGVVAYMHYTKVSAPVVIAPTVSAPIFVNEREEIAGTGEALLQAITDSVSRPLVSGTVRLISVASTTSTENIFPALPLSAPDVLLRNINTTGNMAGVVNVGGNQSAFFILSISSYSNVFSGMLSWEPLMPEYLAKLFPPHQTSVPEMVATSTVATTSTSSPQATTPKNIPKVATTTPAPPAFAAGFYDATIANHDVRVYRDATEREVLLYGFWNQSTLVIARDTAAFTEIVGRLSTASTRQ